jgi:hypothetical protein
MIEQEYCYLSVYGRVMLNALMQKGIKDPDLALEILHLLVPEEELYDLEVADEHREATR